MNNTQAISLLKEVAGSIARPVSAGIPPAPEVTLSVARFVYLDGTPALMALVPSSMLHATPSYDFDPLPPPEHENVFSNEVQRLPWEASRESEAEPTEPQGAEAPEHWIVRALMRLVRQEESNNHPTAARSETRICRQTRTRTTRALPATAGRRVATTATTTRGEKPPFFA